MTKSDTYYRYWGKAAGETQVGCGYHLLPYHSLDVAACGFQLIQQHTGYRRTLSSLTGWDEQVLLDTLPLLLALHDLGKFSPSFQDQRYDVVEEINSRPRTTQEYLNRHDELGYWLWIKALLPHWKASGTLKDDQTETVNLVMQAMTGHHGKPPRAESKHFNAYFPETDRQAAVAFADQLLSLFPRALQHLQPGNMQALRFASWWIAGIGVLSDWLGSNRTWFDYQNEQIPFETYWDIALQRASIAITETELLQAEVSNNLNLADLIDGPESVTATPLQQLAGELPLGEGPQLFILEDVTGAGKTEAALLLAHRLMTAGLADGLYFGLPTMATANAMYERLGKAYRQFYRGDKPPSLVLAHSARELSGTFRQAIIPIHAAEEDAFKHDETPASNHCAEWLADNRKKALLAEVGIGTLDQALLGILPNKHQSLRLLGLSRKVLLVDEVHACDAYMNELLKILLTAHARTGGSAILLSATLPHSQREALQEAFAKGRQPLAHPTEFGFGIGSGTPAPATEKPPTPYPALTHHDADTARAYPVETRDSVKRRVLTEFLDNPTAIEHKIEQWLEQEDCVCWIANTVGDARDIWQRLQLQHPDWSITLFHARYALADRLDIESLVLRRFGKDSAHADRRGQLLIATQVVEQSLDIDFDHLVTDLAPIDLLIQRAGRLHRHNRDRQGNRLNTGQADQRPQPLLTIHAPPWADEPQADWYSKPFPKAAHVYNNHAQLWLGMGMLLGDRYKNGFRMPEDARELIEGVYGETVTIPGRLQESDLDADGQRRSEASIAQLNALNLELSYSRQQGLDWWDDTRTPTRLSEDSQTVWLAVWDGTKLRPLNPGPFTWHRSSLSLRTRTLKAAAIPDDVPEEAVEQITSQLPAKGKWGVLLILAATGDRVWATRGTNGRDEVETFGYSRVLGWMSEKEIPAEAGNVLLKKPHTVHPD